MEEKKFGEKLSDFFAGKGFYIVLLLCAGLIAASIGLMTDGSGTDVERRGNEDTNAVYAAESPAEARPGELPVMRLDPDAVTRPRPTVSPVPTASPTPAPPAPAPETAAAEEEDEGTITVAAASLPAVDYFIWPVNGALLRPHSTAVLGYDATMADWRPHSGWDIAAPAGERVLCTANGVVSAVYDDERLGTVVEVSHQGGLVSVYANLAAEPMASVGQTVSVGSVLGVVGGTALYESGEADHVHFALRLNGEEQDPADWLPKA
jgi:murein DD-endopeptidase MepM/ murein hydrolase activator NlpD